MMEKERLWIEIKTSRKTIIDLQEILANTAHGIEANQFVLKAFEKEYFDKYGALPTKEEEKKKASSIPTGVN